MIPLMEEKGYTLQWFLKFGFENTNVQFSTKDIFPTFEKVLKRNQIQKTKVNCTL